MRLWRISSHRSLSGEGGLYAGGRWHLQGDPVFYCSETASLATLEVLVHVSRRAAPSNLLLIELEAPARLRVETVDPATLSPYWRKYPAPKALASYGSEWLRERRTALRRVPSAVEPKEHNILINPLHRSAHRVKVVGVEACPLDPRLFEGRE